MNNLINESCDDALEPDASRPAAAQLDGMSAVAVSPVAASPKGMDFFAERLSTTQKVLLLGEITYLFLHSRLHQAYFIGDLATFAMTPVRLGQFRLYRSRTRPVGFVAWAYLTDEASDAYATNSRKLTPDDFNAGDNLWIIEFIAPFGHAKQILFDLRHNIFPRKHGRSARRIFGRNRIVVRDWFGAEYQPP